MCVGVDRMGVGVRRACWVSFYYIVYDAAVIICSWFVFVKSTLYLDLPLVAQ